MMKHRILAYCDHQNSITCTMGCIFTIIYSIAFHVCKGAERYPMVDFLTGHRLGTDISSEYRLTGQVLFPNSKNSSIIMYEILSNLLWGGASSGIFFKYCACACVRLRMSHLLTSRCYLAFDCCCGPLATLSKHRIPMIKISCSIAS